ncbi:MAG: hypothetical protein ACOY46_15555 [Bacillota bacterium]
MISGTNVCEVDARREEVWGRFSVEGAYRKDISIEENEGEIVVFGKVVNETKQGVPCLILGLCACRADGTEFPVAFTYAGKDGNFMFSFQKPDVPVERYIVRTGCSSGIIEV